MHTNERWVLHTAVEKHFDWWAGWERLNEESLGRHPLLGARMVRLMCRHFSHRPLIYGALIANNKTLVQLILESDGLGLWRVFCPSQAGLGSLVFDRSVADDLGRLGGLLRALPGMPLAITIPYQDTPYSWVTQGDHNCLQRVVLGTTVTVVNNDGFDAYWNACPKELRDNVRRRMKRAQQDGVTVRSGQVKDSAAIAEAVDRYADLESAGWKGQQGTAIGRGNAQGEFYRALMCEMSKTGEACVAELFFNEKLVASRLLISGPSMHVILKTTYDEAMRNYAPGHLQLHMLMRELMPRGDARAVEFYTKAGRDSLLWATHTRTIDTITLYRARALRRLAEWRQLRSRKLGRRSADPSAEVK